MTTQAKIQKRIYNELIISEQKKQKEIEFIPANLGVRNLSTYFKGADGEQAKERMFLAFHEAYHYAVPEKLTNVRITIVRGVMKFVGERIENDVEFQNRIRQIANGRMYKEWTIIAEKRQAKRELAKAEAKVAELSKKV